MVQIALILFTGLLIAITSPHRQTLQDWMRYRHQSSDRYPSLWKELMFAEKSPAIFGDRFKYRHDHPLPNSSRADSSPSG